MVAGAAGGDWARIQLWRPHGQAGLDPAGALRGHPPPSPPGEGESQAKPDRAKGHPVLPVRYFTRTVGGDAVSGRHRPVLHHK